MQANDFIAVPAAYASFPKDIVPNPPRSWLARCANVQRWSLMRRGGHFRSFQDAASQRAHGSATRRRSFAAREPVQLQLRKGFFRPQSEGPAVAVPRRLPDCAMMKECL